MVRGHPESDVINIMRIELPIILFHKTKYANCSKVLANVKSLDTALICIQALTSSNGFGTILLCSRALPSSRHHHNVSESRSNKSNKCVNKLDGLNPICRCS